LPPVGKEEGILYLKPTQSASQREQAGYRLYRMFESVIILKINMRAIHDPIFAQFLDRLRYGKLTKQDKEFLSAKADEFKQGTFSATSASSSSSSTSATAASILTTTTTTSPSTSTLQASTSSTSMATESTTTTTTTTTTSPLTSFQASASSTSMATDSSSSTSTSQASTSPTSTATESTSKDPYYQYHPIVVATNAMRVALTWKLIEQWATLESNTGNQTQSPSIFATAATFARSPRGQHLDRNTIQHLYTLYEIGTLMPYLPLVYLMRLIVTQNISKLYDIVNGTIGYLVGIKFAANTQFINSCIIPGSNATIARTTKPIECIFIRIPGAKFRAGRVPGLPKQFGDDVYPIFPVTTPSAQVKLPHRHFNVSITQLPVVPAYSHTVHKTQSKTFSGIVVGALRGPGSIKPIPKTAFYVACSRVETRKQLQLAWKPTEKDYEYFQPPKSLTEEMKRLEVLAETTRQNNIINA
jgi:hypothetical protein